MKLIEAVPNISEGQDKQVIDAICQAANGVEGARILHIDESYDANRTVVTIAGEIDAVVESCFQLIAKSYELIDMRLHQGVHPRIGATDVCPLVPISGVSMQECVQASIALSKRVSEELGLPVFLYEESARTAERRNLANIRRGNYESLERKLSNPLWHPDFGPSDFNSKFGAVVIGARDFLIAYNVFLDCKDVAPAMTIAKSLRAARNANSFPGNSLKGLKAIGWYLDECKQAQVSINLTDFRECGMHHAFEACKYFAAQCGVNVVSSELIGLVPERALSEAGRYFMTIGFDGENENALGVKCLGLAQNIEEFVQSRVLENRLRAFSFC